MTNYQPTAIITGANRGLGKETARQLAEQGYLVILTARELAKAQATASALKYENIYPAQLDVSNHESIKQFAAEIGQKFSHIDVLINNAAIHYDTWQRASNVDMNIVEQAMQTNVYGAWNMVLELLPLLKHSKHPRIVNVSSGGGALKGMSGGTPAYSISKAALNALTLMLADELRSDNILVNAVCPDWVATDMGGSGGRPVTEGAAGIVWAATLPDNGPSGGFFRDQKPIAW